jgi:hypothetical protein
MRLTIYSTDLLQTINGVECRMWEGWTDGGTACVVFVHRIAVHKDDDDREFKALLLSKAAAPDWPAEGTPLDERGRVKFRPDGSAAAH